jgi:hypothetical protein
MRKYGIGLCAVAVLAGVTLCRAEPVVPPDVNLNEYGEAGYLWSGYTPQNPGTPIGWKPKEGDIVFMTSPDIGQSVTYAIGRTWHPFHIALIVRQEDGELGIFESGGGGTMEVSLRPILGRLGVYDIFKERRFNWVRRIKTQITPEGSKAMTKFAEDQVGKPFAPYTRLGWFWAPLHWNPHPTHIDQKKWFCSEIVVVALEQGGILPKGKFHPGMTTPRQMFLDCLWNDISDQYHAPLPWSLKLSQPPVPGPKFAPYKARE